MHYTACTPKAHDLIYLQTMIHEHKYSHTTWVRLVSPTQEEVTTLALEYGLNHAVTQDILSSTPRQKVEAHGDLVYAVFHIPAYKSSHSKSHLQEVDFLIGDSFIITVQYDTIDALHRFSKEAEVKHLLGKEDTVHTTPSMIFAAVLKELYGGVQNEMNAMQDDLRVVEDRIFEGKEREMVTHLSRIGRDLLDLKRTLTPHQHHFERLLSIAEVTKNKQFSEHVSYVFERHYRKIADNLTNSIDLMSELRETNNSLVSTKQNEVMKTLTILAFITFPLTLVTGIFGMNTDDTPILGISGDFWYIFGGMVAGTLLMFMYFKYKKWL